MSSSGTFPRDNGLQGSSPSNDTPVDDGNMPILTASNLDRLSASAVRGAAHRGRHVPFISSGSKPQLTEHTGQPSASKLADGLPITATPNANSRSIDERPFPLSDEPVSDLPSRIKLQNMNLEHPEKTENGDLATRGNEVLKSDQSQPFADIPYHSIRQYGPSMGSPRNLSTPPTSREVSSNDGQTLNATARRNSYNPLPRPPPLLLDTMGPAPPLPSTRVNSQTLQTQKIAAASMYTEPRSPSPIPPSIPLPPMSLPTILQLELAGHRPNSLYIHHSYSSEIPYESSAVKFERLKNFLLLPTYLERTINFGALACLDAWLWTLTILPLRFLIALGVLARWWAYLVGKETRWVITFVWGGLGRMWQRGRSGQPPRRPTTVEYDECLSARKRNKDSRPDVTIKKENTSGGNSQTSRTRWGHRRTKSVPSNLTSFHKADLLQGAVIIFSCTALMNLDASRMYHFIRAQSAVKLYVIYNLIEVGDRLLSALGQDVFECLFSSETLSRNASGRSKIVLPLGMFLLSLVYNIAHSIVLFYQVITLNVAVNSYSNALLSLLMSNQFVEVKSSVFKRTEKENTFQLACADIVERFQLWLVLFIIALRNIVEIGGLSVPGVGAELGVDDVTTKVPLHNTSILPASFTILPPWIVSGEVLSPFLIVIGSEMVVDWIKHAYINKFNNIRPNFYGRILDILCKDYYTNAFITPALTRRIGLPLIPLCTLFIRSSIQTYNMFLATHLPSPLPPTTHTLLSVESATSSSPAMIASLERLDSVIRNALGRAVYGTSDTLAGKVPTILPGRGWSSDDIIAAVMMIVVFFITFLILLIAKLLLGMALLRYSRGRYVCMKIREQAEAAGISEIESFDSSGKRTGGYGKVEVGEDRRRWLFQDDPTGLRKLRDRERREIVKGKKDTDMNTITRYEMIAKRIW